MKNLINELAAIDIELARLRQPNAAGQTPEFWTAAAECTRLLNLIGKIEIENKHVELPAE